MSQEEGKKFISYRDVLEWVEDFEFTHHMVVAWVLKLARQRGSGRVIQEVTAIARMKTEKGDYKFVTQTHKAFGQGSDHATLPGAMIACIHELDGKLREIEGPRLSEDPHGGRNPFS